MSRGRLLAIAACMSCSVQGFAQVQEQPSEGRGELLYSTHCRDCHTAEVHWRDKKRATDWNSLKVQVRRWQDNIGLVWEEADIASVARYLNATYYRFPLRTAEGGVPYASGGIGQDERVALHAGGRDHNLKLVFAERGSGAYLADVKVVIEGAQGGKILEATSQGPWFLATLPPGGYRISAESRGERLTRSIAISPGKRSELTYYWP